MKVCHAINIACAPVLVWSYLEDTEKVKRWMSGLIETERDTPGDLTEGATFRMRIQEGGRVSEYRGEVLLIERPVRLQLSLRGGSFGDMPMTIDYRLIASPNGVRLEFEQNVRLAGVYRMMTPLFVFFGRLQIRTFLQTLKALAEAEARSPV